MYAKKTNLYSRKITRIKIIFLSTALFLNVANSIAQDCDYFGTIGQLDWCIKDSTLTISGIGKIPNYDYDNAPWQPYWEEITNVVIGNEITAIGNGAFSDYMALTSVNMPNVMAIGNDAFSWCTALASVNMPNVITIGNDAFIGCFSLNSVDMPNVTTIGNSTFQSCSILASVNMPSVTAIGIQAFYSCSTLASVDISSIVTSIGNGSFADCSRLTSINVDKNNAVYCSEDGILFNKSKTELIQYPAGKQGKNYVIPDSVTTIGYAAFQSCSVLASVVMPSITTIEENAFFSCIALDSIDMPNVTTIGEMAFSDCNALVSVDMPSVTVIEEEAFYRCRGLAFVYMPSVTTIGFDAFYLCTALASVNMSSCLATVEQYAFDHCTGLKHIYSHSLAPPIAYSNSFYYASTSTCILHVPYGSEDDYAAADGWKDFTIEGNITNIFNIKSENTLDVIYPNPTKDILHIRLSSQEVTDYTVYNVAGYTVMQGRLRDGETINVEKLSSGVYWLKTRAGTGTIRFVKQ